MQPMAQDNPKYQSPCVQLYGKDCFFTLTDPRVAGLGRLCFERLTGNEAVI